MWQLNTRRRDVVIQKRLAPQCAKWLVQHAEEAQAVLSEEDANRFQRLLSTAVLNKSDTELWPRFSRVVMSVFTPEQWQQIRKRFYNYRRKMEQDGTQKATRTIQVPVSIYQELADIKQQNGQTFAEVIDDLLSMRKSHPNNEE
ncbi:hypothetical protein [Aliidiomarina quisquiliarum]|uniref:hypothetical protein n=1 Tax=Aliidiomarina quisquiliarum TaxID=2938947 RepID=UPI00208E3BD2|nr:hypothetical protein [Aliidiomarina quisquiliarum]MCO4320348.1 hypothetical protein [Aliidiomarina quisquiliarum]